MTVTVYKSTDTSAPVLSNTSGSLVALLKACLVNGYGSKPSSGWSIPVDAGSSAIFRNAGSLKYFKIKDDGIQQTTQITPDYNLATITGAASYTDINTLTLPFPRTITGVNRHSNTWYGCSITKGSYASNAWILVADEKTCYLLINAQNTAIDSSTGLGVVVVNAFGDFKPLGNITNNPKAFVHTKDFNITQSSYPGFAYTGVATGFMEHSLDGGNESTQFIVNPGYLAVYPYDKAFDYTSCGYFSTIYPSPITGGLVLEQLLISDDTNNIVRTNKHTVFQRERFAAYAGIYGCMHTVGSFGGAYKVCDNFDTVNADGRDYLVFSAASSESARMTLAIDMTGPW